MIGIWPLSSLTKTTVLPFTGPGCRRVMIWIILLHLDLDRRSLRPRQQNAGTFIPIIGTGVIKAQALALKSSMWGPGNAGIASKKTIFKSESGN